MPLGARIPGFDVSGNGMVEIADYDGDLARNDPARSHVASCKDFHKYATEYAARSFQTTGARHANYSRTRLAEKFEVFRAW